MAEGSTGQTELSQHRLAELQVLVPPLAEQRGIAATLGALDDKIESNKRIVDKIGLLFAAEFSSVQEGATSFVELREIVSITKGVSYRSADLVKARTSLVTLKSFDRNGGYKAVGLKPYVGPYKESQVIRTGELIVAQTDLTQGAEVVGRAVRVPRASSADVLVASLDLAIVRPLGNMPEEYLYGLLTAESFREHCRSRTSGTTVLHLAGDAIPQYRAPLVPLVDQERFAKVSHPLIERSDSLEREIECLIHLRDTLLPELLSGRIRVPEAQEAVETVV
jgi:type I restriction enzyme S subunit